VGLISNCKQLGQCTAGERGKGEGEGGLGDAREGWGEQVEEGRPGGSWVAGQGRGWEVRESVEFSKWVLGSSHHHNARGVSMWRSWRAYWEG